ncbi:MAG: FecCD family ABC transporter permease [Mycetocola sp.]
MSAATEPAATVTIRRGRFSVRVPLRTLRTTLILTVVAVFFAVVALCFGDYPLTLPQVLSALTGTGEPFHRTVVGEWRLPIALSSVVFGALLGLGGAIFQSLTRNPLGSPDVIGFDAGSYTAVVVVMLVLGSYSSWTIAVAATTGGLATALVVYLLAYRRGVQGFSLIIIGIAVSVMLGSVNAYLITRADITDAMTVGFWGAGSLSRVSWSSLMPSLALGLLIAVAAAALTPSLRRLELGDDAAASLGIRPGRARLLLIIVGVATVALVTAAAGPISFIALVAPQLARRIDRRAGVDLPSSAAMGAALLSAAQLLSLMLSSGLKPVPVGLVTVCLGGVYLIWLLIRETRNQAGHGL